MKMKSLFKEHNEKDEYDNDVAFKTGMEPIF